MAKQPFATLRVQKVKSFQGAQRLDDHNTRNMDVPHADEGYQHLNKQLYGSGDVKADIQAGLDRAGITKLRKNGTIALEFVLSASPEYFGSDQEDYQPKGVDGEREKPFIQAAMDFLKEEFGEENIVNSHIHFDEKTPHIHALCLPVVEKHVRAVERRSNRTYDTSRLNSQAWIGGRLMLRGLQDRYFEKTKEYGMNLKRGIEKGKGAPERYSERADRRIEAIKKEGTKALKELKEANNEIKKVHQDQYLEQFHLDQIKAEKAELEDLQRHLGELLQDKAKSLESMQHEQNRIYHEFKGFDLEKREDVNKAQRSLERIAQMNEQIKKEEEQLRKVKNKLNRHGL